jgi:L-iditol 2-dehydrogenase
MNVLQVVEPGSFTRMRLAVPELPSISGDHLVVKTSWAMTCGSDIPFFTGKKRYQSYPLSPGAPIHECTGVVVESTSIRFRPGDPVLAIPEENRGLAEYFLAHADKTVVLRSPETDDTAAACLIQPLATVMNAVDRLGDLSGKTVAVVGLGAIGLLFCWILGKRGAGAITGIDLSAGRCQTAERMGAASQTFTGPAAGFIHTAAAHADDGVPFDICIEAAGHQMDTLNDCFHLVRECGTVLAFGVPDNPVYSVEYEIFFRKNAVLMAAVTPDWKVYLPKAQDLFRENRKELSALVTHRFPMKDAEKAFGMCARREDGVIKTVLDAGVW